MNRAERIAEQLGMPHGTATNKLRKAVLFDCVCRLNENICYKCEQKIETKEDFSIEHKIPWEGRDTELFWNLSNIAYSHLKCNRPHEYNGKGTPKHATKCPDDGVLWCWNCQQCLPEIRFTRNRATTTGFEYICAACRATRRNEGKTVC